MDNRKLADELDRAIEAIVAEAESIAVPAGSELAKLLPVAIRLKGLPREGFRDRLKEELMNSETTLTGKTEPDVREYARPGFHTITPYLAVHGAAALLEFVKTAFGAEELFRSTGSLGGIHAEVRIGDSMLMIGGDAPGPFDVNVSSLHLYVPDADAVYGKAMAAGATSLEEPVDQPYGDREAGVADASGNHWWIATHRAGESYRPEGHRALTSGLYTRGAAGLIDYLGRAFAAETQSRHESPGGAVRYAKVRIGDSLLEVSEAHGPYQPRPAMFYVYIPNVDATHRRAVEAGGDSLSEPADQPYGDRTAAVRDPFGNSWYLATRIAKTAG